MKKSLLWVLVLVVSISMIAAFSLSGCKEKAAEEEVAEEEEVAAEEEEVAVLPSGNLTIWVWEPNDLWLDASLEGFNDVYPDITWEYVKYGTGDVYVNLPLAITAGTGAPDICITENTRLKSLIDMGGLLDITDRLQPYVDNLSAAKLADAEMDGHYFAVPWEPGPVALYYRRDVFERAGLPTDPDAVAELLSTYDKYYDVAKTIKEETGVFMQAQSQAQNNGRLFEMLLWQQGLGYVDDAGNIAINSPAHVATLEFIGKMVSEGLYSDTVDWTDPWYAEFSSIDAPGVATYIEASWMAGVFKSWLAPDTTGLWGVVPMPAWTEGGVRASNDTGDSFIIPAQTANPDAAWALLEYALLRDESVINCYLAGGYTPSLLSALSSDAFATPDPFFADQPVGVLFNEIVPNIPKANIYITEYAEVVNLLTPEIQKYLTGTQTAQEALDNAAVAMRAATGRQ
jgi:lactose/L-arabinose transport system substrate-binding protein